MILPGLGGIEILTLIKQNYPSIQVIIITAHSTIKTAIEAMKLGAYDYVTKPFDPDDLSHLIRNATKQISLTEENEVLKKKVVSLEDVEDLVGNSEEMKKVFKDIESVAQSNSSVEEDPGRRGVRPFRERPVQKASG